MLYGQWGVGLSIEQDGKPHSGQHPWWAPAFLCQQSQGWVTGEGSEYWQWLEDVTAISLRGHEEEEVRNQVSRERSCPCNLRCEV